MTDSNSKTYIEWKHITSGVNDIKEQLEFSNWTPDIIIGVANGGVIPATLLAKQLGLPVRTIIVQLRDGITEDLRSLRDSLWDKWSNQRILIVDDINDTGATLNRIIDEIKECPVDVKTAVLYTKVSSRFNVNYYFEDCSYGGWLVFPWEDAEC